MVIGNTLGTTQAMIRRKLQVFFMGQDSFVQAATSGNFPVMVGATGTTAGTAGVCAAPSAGDESKVWSGAGTWIRSQRDRW